MEVAVDTHLQKGLRKALSSWSDRRHLIDTKDLTLGEIDHLLKLAREFRSRRATGEAPPAVSNSTILANLFYENSTRTRASFELAARALGMTVLNLDASSSSVQKGETIEDTARTLLAMGVSIIVQRHSASGSAERLVQKFGDRLHIINAGDGTNAHPTQALLDLMTMTDVSNSLSGAKIAIVGDISYSRVARSDIWLLKKLGAEIHAVGPPTLVPMHLDNFGVVVHKKLDEALASADFVIALRLQLERQQAGLIPSIEEYACSYRLSHERLKVASANVKLLHPGPINRGIEITDELADDPQISLIDQQVANGVLLRMAVVSALSSIPACNNS
jgi:aspartate carbamoyltransferase catalytic subunit